MFLCGLEFDYLLENYIIPKNHELLVYNALILKTINITTDQLNNKII